MTNNETMKYLGESIKTITKAIIEIDKHNQLCPQSNNKLKEIIQSQRCPECTGKMTKVGDAIECIECKFKC